jgi:nucleoside phosphorylase
MSEQKIDFAIITAIDVEREAICQAFDLTGDDRVRKENRTYWYKRLLLKNDEFYEIVIGQSLDMANVNAALLTNQMLHHWQPTAVLMVGIAATAKPEAKQGLGNVVIGKEIAYYELGKITADKILPEPKQVPADATLLDRVQSLPKRDFPISVDRPDNLTIFPQIEVGVIASGDNVIADAATRDAIAAANRKILAIEMEGYGVIEAVRQQLNPVRCLVIRALCDYADDTKNDVWHPYAAAVAAGFAKHFLLDRPLEPRNPPLQNLQIDGIDPQYRPILEAFKYGSVVPFLGAGINPEAFLSLVSSLASEIREDLQRQAKWSSSESQDKELIRRLVGTPCSICHYLLEDRPDPCPLKEGMKTDCPLYQEQKLTIAKTNLRCLMSQYLKSKQGDIHFYNKLRAKVREFQSISSSQICQFITKEFPSLMSAKGHPNSHPGFPYQLIITTNYDISLENYFKENSQEFDVVYYIAEGAKRGKFKHKFFDGEEQDIPDQEYGREGEFQLVEDFNFGLRRKALKPRLIILKLFGSIEEPFAVTEKQIQYLVDTGIKNLPSIFSSIIQQSSLLFLGYPLQDFDLKLIVEMFPTILEQNRSEPRWIMHQSQPGELEKKFWNKPEDVLIFGSTQDLINNLRKGLQ